MSIYSPPYSEMLTLVYLSSSMARKMLGSLFSGNTEPFESNIRRSIIENDRLEAIIQLPNNLSYNTGITTYIWLLANSKPSHQKGKVQLIDASELYRKLRKNLGAKNCEFAPDHIAHITRLYLDMPDHMKETPLSKIFDNSDFGYYKVTVERPLRLAAQFTPERLATLRFVPTLSEIMAWAYERRGDAIYAGLADHQKAIEDHIGREALSLSPKNRKVFLALKTKATFKISSQENLYYTLPFTRTSNLFILNLTYNINSIHLCY